MFCRGAAKQSVALSFGMASTVSNWGQKAQQEGKADEQNQV